jgi:membrane fusion protein (multidrug efflux system)
MEIGTSVVPITTTLIGQLDSPQNVEVRARVEGFIDEARFTEGVEIQQGEILFELDPKPYLERLAAANGSMAEANAALNKYQKDVARLAPLVERRAIPQQDLDNALASVDVGKAGVITAQARVESAQLDVGYCEIRSPITGLIGAKQVSIGELVGKGEPTLLATLSTLDPIWFYCNVSEVDYMIAEGKIRNTGLEISKIPLTLILASGPEHAEKGSVVFIDRAVDVKTGTLRIRAEFPNPQKILRPGMFARIRMDLGNRNDCIQIPERAVVEMQGRAFVWVIDKAGIANQRPVKLADLVNFNYIVTDGLSVGDRIVVEGLQKVHEGKPVRALTAAQMSALQSAQPKSAKE